MVQFWSHRMGFLVAIGHAFDDEEALLQNMHRFAIDSVGDTECDPSDEDKICLDGNEEDGPWKPAFPSTTNPGQNAEANKSEAALLEKNLWDDDVPTPLFIQLQARTSDNKKCYLGTCGQAYGCPDYAGVNCYGDMSKQAFHHPEALSFRLNQIDDGGTVSFNLQQVSRSCLIGACGKESWASRKFGECHTSKFDVACIPTNSWRAHRSATSQRVRFLPANSRNLDASRCKNFVSWVATTPKADTDYFLALGRYETWMGVCGEESCGEGGYGISTYNESHEFCGKRNMKWRVIPKKAPVGFWKNVISHRGGKITFQISTGISTSEEQSVSKEVVTTIGGSLGGSLGFEKPTGESASGSMEVTYETSTAIAESWTSSTTHSFTKAKTVDCSEKAGKRIALWQWAFKVTMPDDSEKWVHTNHFQCTHGVDAAPRPQCPYGMCHGDNCATCSKSR